jgi:threonine synthase
MASYFPSLNISTAEATSFLVNLECSGCGEIFSYNEVHTFCPDRQSPLLAHYDLVAIRNQVDREAIRQRPRGMWRWHELLPVRSPANFVFLGEGDTALLPVPNIGRQLGLPNLYVKDESSNPTSSCKARGLAAAVSKAKQLGIQKVIIPTAGNAGEAMAAYAARAGIQALIYMPRDTPNANIQESRMAGAEVMLVDGIISDAASMAGVRAKAEGWFDLSTFKEPYRLEGKKIMGYELAEAFDWELPDVIIYPTGGGTGHRGHVESLRRTRSTGLAA